MPNEFHKSVAATIADYLDNGADDWDRDEGIVRVTARTPTSVTLSVFTTDENGEPTETEIDRVTVQVIQHILK